MPRPFLKIVAASLRHWSLLLLLPWPLLAQAGEISRLEELRRKHPADAIVLYNLAALRAASGDSAATLELLEAVSRAPGGLDPGVYGGFRFLHGDSRFQQLVARIRAENPPMVRSRTAFTIPERDLHPEGMAWDPVTRSIFSGSFKGKIIRVDAQGAASDFAWVLEPGAPHRVVVGIRVDSARGHLWAAVEDPRAFGEPTLAGSALHQYEIHTGRLLARYAGPGFGALNDVAVAPSGEAFATNSSDGSIWRAVPGQAAMDEFLPAGSVPEANGITFSADGTLLFIAGWHDIARVELRTRALLALPAPPGVTTGNLDGLYYHRGTLVGIQNGVHPGRVVRFRLDAEGRSITGAEVLERYHPLHNGVATGALDGDSFLYFVNTQSRSFHADGTPINPATLSETVIVRLPLDGPAAAGNPRSP